MSELHLQRLFLPVFNQAHGRKPDGVATFRGGVVGEGGRRKLGLASSAFAEKHGVIIPESLKCLSPPLAPKWKSVATVNRRGGKK